MPIRGRVLNFLFFAVLSATPPSRDLWPCGAAGQLLCIWMHFLLFHLKTNQFPSQCTRPNRNLQDYFRYHRLTYGGAHGFRKTIESLREFLKRTSAIRKGCCPAGKTMFSSQSCTVSLLQLSAPQSHWIDNPLGYRWPWNSYYNS